MDEREREGEREIGLEEGRCTDTREERRNTWIWLWGSVQVLRPAIVFRAHCSCLFFLRAWHVPRDGTHGSLPCLLAAFSRWTGLKKKKVARRILSKYSNLLIAWKERERSFEESLRAAWWKKRSSSPNPRQSIERGLSDDRRITTFVNGLNTRPRQLCELSKIDTLSLQRSTWISSLTSGNYEPLDSLRVRCKIILISCSWDDGRGFRNFRIIHEVLFFFSNHRWSSVQGDEFHGSRGRGRGPRTESKRRLTPPGNQGGTGLGRMDRAAYQGYRFYERCDASLVEKTGSRISRKGENCIGGLVGATRFKCKSD